MAGKREWSDCRLQRREIITPHGTKSAESTGHRGIITPHGTKSAESTGHRGIITPHGTKSAEGAGCRRISAPLPPHSQLLIHLHVPSTRLSTVTAPQSAHSQLQPDSARLQRRNQHICSSNPTQHGYSAATSTFAAPARLSTVTATQPAHLQLQPDTARLQRRNQLIRSSNPTQHGYSDATSTFAAPTRLSTVTATQRKRQIAPTLRSVGAGVG